jgi:hypothetical protein
MRRREQMTRHGLYGYAFRYDGADAAGFRARLGEETGVPVGSVYEPLNRSPLYLPRTKRRYEVPGQWERIDPTRFDLPVATRAYERESVVIPHEVLLASWDELQSIPEAVERIRG